eukprot:486403_1
MGKCDIRTCKLTERHNRDRTKDRVKTEEYGMDVIDSNTASEELEFVYIRDLFDGIHCYIMHQYDFGFRQRKKHQQPETHYADKTFSNNNNKYIINSDSEFHYGNSSNTFMEVLFQKLQNVSGLDIKTFLEDEEYDSEAVMDDINRFDNND